jgi:DNA modification methylase
MERKPPKSAYIPWKRAPLERQSTTLWDFPSQGYGGGFQGDKDYKGVTPAYVIWNLIDRYTREGDLVVDPMCGSGTTLDVCRDFKRNGVGFDIAPYRADIQKADARALPLENEAVDFFFMDPPYSTHIKYSGDPQCIGELDSRTTAYYQAMNQVIGEAFRVLKNRRYFAIYVSDSFKKGAPFSPIGFELFELARRKFHPVDIVCVTRHGKKLNKERWHETAAEGNFFLRGFNYLFIFKKEIEKPLFSAPLPK